jgi:serine/threonine-protein kinase HipA
VSTRSAGDSQDDTPPRIVKWHQEDLCQLTGRLPRRKYQRDGGPGVRDVADTIRRFSGLPGPDLRDLLTALIANVCLGNGDAHGKNFALLHTPNGVRLSPFYDIVSTEIYPALSPDLSMKFGHTYLPHALSANDVKRFATDLGMAPAAVREAIEHVTTALTSVCDAVLDETTALVGGESDALVRLRALMRVRVPAVEALARKA